MVVPTQETRQSSDCNLMQGSLDQVSTSNETPNQIPRSSRLCIRIKFSRPRFPILFIHLRHEVEVIIVAILLEQLMKSNLLLVY